METTPCVFVDLTHHLPIAAPMTRSSGRASGATTCTWSPARAQGGRDLQADETRANYQTIAPAVPACAIIASLSASVRSTWTCGSDAPGTSSLIGSAPVASSSAPIVQASSVRQHERVCVDFYR